MITNINYKGRLAAGELERVPFKVGTKPPVQHVVKISCGTMLIFQSGNYRIMGVRDTCLLDHIDGLPYKIDNFELQSASLAFNVGYVVNLSHMHKRLTSRRCCFEPEIFPAARLLDYNPLCVNVFQSGKVTVVGVKNLDFVQDLIFFIESDIKRFSQ